MSSRTATRWWNGPRARVAWNVLLFASVAALIVTGGRMALAGQAANMCTLVVPADPLSAKGLATPYQMMGPCHESNPNTAAFVQGAIVDPATGHVSVYDPLVVDQGKLPAVTPVRPSLPAGAVVGLWFGFNGDTLALRGTGNSLQAGNCVTGLRTSAFGQFAYCNGPAFFAAASAAIDSGKLAIPNIGTGSDGRPCPTVRDFGLVDMDQSDNVTSTYLFLSDGSTAQNTAANQAALSSMGARILLNGSDNALLDDFLDPALGCVPFTAPDLAQPGRLTTSLALNELQASRFQPQPSAVVPITDPMVLVSGNTSVAKANLYRAGVGQPPVDATTDTPTAYCQNLADIGPARIQLDRRLTQRAKSPNPAGASNLFTFLAQRLSGAFDALDCGTLLHRENPVAVVTDKNGVAVGARFAVAVPPATPHPVQTATVPPSPSPSHSATPRPTTPPATTQPNQPAAPPTTTAPTTPSAAHTTTAPNPARTTNPPDPALTHPPATAAVPAPVQSPTDGQATTDPAPGSSDQPSPDPAGAAPPAGTSSGPPAVTAPDHHLTAAVHLPITGTTIGVGLLVAGAVLAVVTGVRMARGMRRRALRVKRAWY